jgi:hypothetical protein
MMNSNPKLDLHPDAESLNAFAEQALGERERGRIVAHLAECGRCREVVYLAREAAVELEPELAVAAAAPGRSSDSLERKEPRFWNRRIAWVTAGALAVAVTAAYVAHVRQVEIAAEQARTAREAAARTVEMASAPETAQMEMKATALQAVPSPTAAMKGKSEATSHELRPMTAEAAPPALVAGATAKSSSDEVAQPGRLEMASPTMSAAAGREPEQTGVARQSQREVALEASQVQSQAAGASPQAKAAKPVVHKATGGLFAAAAARPAQVDADREVSEVGTGGGQMGSGVIAYGRARPAALPSGLPAVSTVSARGLTVAVDEAGGVFVSEDAGGRWKSVTKQWSGRAVVVRLQVSAAGESVSTSAETVFDIVNDQGQVWVSTDGRNWKAQ